MSSSFSMFKLRYFVIAFAIVVILGYLWLPPAEAVRIHFRVPDGYQGPINVRLGGVPPIIGQDSESRKRYEWSVLPDGTLFIDSFDLFHRWHILTAAYDSNKPIASEFLQTANDIGLRGGVTEDGISTYFIGTYAEWMSFRNTRL